MKKEELLNIPNPITALRIPIGLLAAYYLLIEGSVVVSLTIFLIAAFTDFLDGFLARRLKQVTEFGAKLDLYSDRILTFIIVIALILFYISDYKIISFIILILSREIISIPGVIIRKIRKLELHPVNMIGKTQTAFQFITIGLIFLNVSWLIYPVMITSFWGLVSASNYIYNSIKSSF